MPWTQKALMTFGLFWLSLWVALILQLPFGSRLIPIGVPDKTVLSGIAMGMMMSIGRTLAAILAGVTITKVVPARRSELWALILGVLYVVDAPVRHLWIHNPTDWDRLWAAVELVFPAVACVIAAVIAARLQRKKIARAV